MNLIYIIGLNAFVENQWEPGSSSGIYVATIATQNGCVATIASQIGYVAKIATQYGYAATIVTEMGMLRICATEIFARFARPN